MTDSDIKTEDVVQEEQIETTQILAPLAIEELRLKEQTPEKLWKSYNAYNKIC